MSGGAQPLRIALALGLLGGAGVVLGLTPEGQRLWGLLWEPRPERVLEALPDTFAWLVVTLIGFMVLHTLLPLPAELLALAAGMTLGPVWGVATIWLGAMLGAWLGFFLARTLGRPFLRYLIAPERLDPWLNRLQQADAVLLLAVRLLPIVSFNLINYTLGLGAIGWWRFTWTTAVGILPVTGVMVVFGANLHDWRVLVLMTTAAVLVGVGGYVMLRWRSVAAWGMPRR